jgi:hypothetical protein
MQNGKILNMSWKFIANIFIDLVIHTSNYYLNLSTLLQNMGVVH